LPDKKQIFLEKHPNAMMAFPYFGSTDSKAHLKEIYSIHEASMKRVAGRDVRVLHLMPKDQYRYQYRFYVDKQRQFLLRSEIVSDHGRVLEQVGFTDISFDVGPLPQPSLLPTEQGWQISRKELSSLKAADLPYQFSDALHGFKRVNQFCRSKDNDRKVHQFVFSDGLSTVSVFVKKSETEVDSQPLSLGYGAVMFKSMVQNGYVVTALGEVPERTLSLFLRSMQWKSR
jgi:sigma-E factor negative regulatory protein RseB